MRTAQLTLPDGRQLGYHIRLSKRARYMRLTFSGDKGLVVTQPAGVPAREIDKWVHSKLDWISNNFDKINQRNQVIGKNKALQRPGKIDIPLLQQTLEVEYKPDDRNEIIIDYDAQNQLTLSGMTGNTEFCVQALQKWLQRYSRMPLGKLLEEMADHTGLQYNDFRVKAQRTRWGSCSSKGNINLNYKLALMPEHWARYTVVHELCHTVELNHSKRFWTLVERFVPDYKIIHTDMKNASQVLPQWANYNG